jgi:carbon-monoxide dehydrogenase medium subunit
MNINTRILKHQFDYLNPREMGEVLELLDQHGSQAQVIAGGTDVIPNLKLENIAPQVLVSVANVSDLSFIEDGDSLRIGAGTKLRAVARHCFGSAGYGALHDALVSIGKIQVLNMGTLAGNLCTASPAADSAPALLVLDGSVKLVSSKAERTVALVDFFQGPGRTVKEPNELMTEIIIPQPPTASAFVKMARVESDISKITCAVSLTRSGDAIASCKIAMGAVAPTPIRIPEAEKVLAGGVPLPAMIEEAGRQAAQGIKPVSDVRSTADYRTQVAPRLFRDTFELAWKRAGDEK